MALTQQQFEEHQAENAALKQGNALLKQEVADLKAKLNLLLSFTTEEGA